MNDLLIKGGTVLDAELGVLEADVRIGGGRITEVGPGLPTDSTTVVVDAAGALAIPGFVNAHTHSGQALNRGSTPNLPLDVWLARVVFAEPEIGPDDAYTTYSDGTNWRIF